MKNLKNEKCWCIYKSGEGFFGLDNKPAADGNLTTFAEASYRLHRLANGQYPVPYSLAVSLDAADVICISLRNSWDGERIIDGAAAWADMIGSYTERCWPSADGTSVRILCRGKIPEGAVIPARVQIQTSGFVTLTCQRISPRPSWRPDPGGIIADASGALEHFLVPKGPEYVGIGIRQNQ